MPPTLGLKAAGTRDLASIYFSFSSCCTRFIEASRCLQRTSKGGVSVVKEELGDGKIPPGGEGGVA